MKNKIPKPQPPIIKNDKENPIPVEVIAEAIIQVAKGFQAMRNSKLSRRAIILLIKDSCPGNPAISDISNILDSAASLDKKYIKQ
jgi:hypothetical protein